jgi:hypothetical protein
VSGVNAETTYYRGSLPRTRTEAVRLPVGVSLEHEWKGAKKIGVPTVHVGNADPPNPMDREDRPRLATHALTRAA